MKLLVRNLTRNTTEAELKALFQPFGTVQSCTLVLDKDTQISKGFALMSPSHNDQPFC
jgi:RNA recognition motif-containing protein